MGDQGLSQYSAEFLQAKRYKVYVLCPHQVLQPSLALSFPCSLLNTSEVLTHCVVFCLGHFKGNSGYYEHMNVFIL